MACLVADVLKHRKDARVDAEVDENVDLAVALLMSVSGCTLLI